jgi:hypothetical protein
MGGAGAGWTLGREPSFDARRAPPGAARRPPGWGAAARGPVRGCVRLRARRGGVARRVPPHGRFVAPNGHRTIIKRSRPTRTGVNRAPQPRLYAAMQAEHAHVETSRTLAAAHRAHAVRAPDSRRPPSEQAPATVAALAQCAEALCVARPSAGASTSGSPQSCSQRPAEEHASGERGVANLCERRASRDGGATRRRPAGAHPDRGGRRWHDANGLGSAAASMRAARAREPERRARSSSAATAQFAELALLGLEARRCCHQAGDRGLQQGCARGRMKEIRGPATGTGAGHADDVKRAGSGGSPPVKRVGAGGAPQARPAGGTRCRCGLICSSGVRGRARR